MRKISAVATTRETLRLLALNLITSNSDAMYQGDFENTVIYADTYWGNDDLLMPIEEFSKRRLAPIAAFLAEKVRWLSRRHDGTTYFKGALDVSPAMQSIGFGAADSLAGMALRVHREKTSRRNTRRYLFALVITGPIRWKTAHNQANEKEMP